MRIIKRIIAAVLFVFTFLILAVAGTFLLISDTALMTQVTKAVESATGARIEYQKDLEITRTLWPLFGINDFFLNDNENGFAVYCNSLKFQISLPALLFGRLEIPLLALGDTRVELFETNVPKERHPSGPLPFMPVLNDIQISQISIIGGSQELNLSAMSIKKFNVKIKPGDPDTLLITLQTKLLGNTFDAVATLPRIQRLLESRHMPFFLAVKNDVSSLSTEGRIDFSSASPTIEARLQANARELPAFLSESVEPLKNIHLSTQLSGTYQHLHLKECQLDVKTMNELDLKITGRLDLTHGNQGLKPENINLSLMFAGPNTRSARMLLFDTVPELGAINGHAQIQSKKGDPSLKNIVVKTIDKKGIQVDLSGRIERIPLDPDVSNAGYDLDVTMTSERTSVMGERLDLHLPVEGPLKISYKIQGDTQALQLNKIDLFAGEKDKTQINAMGHILFGNWDQADPVEKLDLAMEVKSPNTQAIGAMIEKQLPELGAMTAKARLHTVSKKHRIDDIHIKTENMGPLLLKVTGSADQVIFFPEPSLEGIKLLATAAGEDTAFLSDLFSLETAIPSMGRFKAKANITGNSKKMGASDLSFASVLRDKGKTRLDLDIKGQFKDFSKIESLSLDTRIKAVDLEAIGLLFNQKWPAIGPVKLNSKMTKDGEPIKLNTTMTIDKIQIKGANRIFFFNNPPLISGTIQANNFYFPELADFKKNDDNEKQGGNPYFFSRAPINFDWLDKADIDLSIDIKSFDKEKSRFESAYLKLDLESSHLSAKPVRFNFPKGKLEFDMFFNMQNEFKLKINAAGKEIDPYQALSLSQAEIKDDFDADIDIDIDLTTSGVNEHELLSNMDGDIYMIIKSGKMRKELFDLLFVDVIGWTFHKVLGSKYINVDCGVLDYKIEQGVVTTDAFFISGEDITIAGKGTVDLGQEKIDYLFLPKKESVFPHSAEPVRIQGSLSDPSITAIPWKSAARTYGSLIFSPYLFAGQVVVNFMSDAMKHESIQSPCVKYEKKRSPSKKK